MNPTTARHATVDLDENGDVTLFVDVLADTPGVEIEGDDSTFDVVLVRPGIAPNQGDPIAAAQAARLNVFYGDTITVRAVHDREATGYDDAVEVEMAFGTLGAPAVEVRFQGNRDEYRARREAEGWL